MVRSRKQEVKKRGTRKKSVRRTKKRVDKRRTKRRTKRRSRRHRRTKWNKVARKKQRGGICERDPTAGMNPIQCIEDCEKTALYKELESANHKLAWDKYKLKHYSPRNSHQLCTDVCDLLECGPGAKGDTNAAWRLREERVAMNRVKYLNRRIKPRL